MLFTKRAETVTILAFRIGAIWTLRVDIVNNRSLSRLINKVIPATMKFLAPLLPGWQFIIGEEEFIWGDENGTIVSTETKEMN